MRDFQERWKQVDCCGDYWPFDWGGTDGSQSGESDNASDGSELDSPPQIDPAVVWQDDFDKDGMEEAFFLSGAFRTPDENVVYSELWYEDASGARQIDSATAYFEPDASVFDVGDRKLFIIDDYTDGSVGVMGAKVWTVKDGEPATLSISSNSKDICFIRQEQGLEFSFSHSSYDTGHTSSAITCTGMEMVLPNMAACASAKRSCVPWRGRRVGWTRSSPPAASLATSSIVKTALSISITPPPDGG